MLQCCAELYEDGFTAALFARYMRYVKTLIASSAGQAKRPTLAGSAGARTLSNDGFSIRLERGL